MNRSPVFRLLLVCGAVAARAAAQTAAPPVVVGTLVGPGATPAEPALRLYGTDLGWTFEHRGRLVMLFGDTWAAADSLCEGEPRNDDSVATLPLALPDGVPPLTFVTRPDAPDDFARIAVRRGADSLTMAHGQVPIAGFSDGTRAAAVLGRGEYVRCTRAPGRKRPGCRRKDFFLPGRPSFGAAFDIGRFYGANIIDAYTRAAGPMAVDLFWNVSTWNPYAVVLMRSRIEAGPPAAACSKRRGPLRWCERGGRAADPPPRAAAPGRLDLVAGSA